MTMTKNVPQLLMTVLIPLLLLLVSFVDRSSSQVVTCTVGTNQTFPTIQDGLVGCNSGIGNITLLIANGTYTEPGVYFPETLASVEMYPLEVNLSMVPAAPEPTSSEMAVRWVARDLWVKNVTASIYFEAIWFSGVATRRPLFYPRLWNNNATFSKCLFSDYRGNDTLTIEGQDEVSMIKVTNSRFFRVWGAALNVTGSSDYLIRNNTFARCGGFNNRSCVNLHMHDRARGDAVLEDNVHYLIADTLRTNCRNDYDPDGMVICRNGRPYCYNIPETESRGDCPLIETIFWNITAQEFQNTTDFDRACRVYVPCTCSTLEFRNETTGITEFFPNGDLFYYTGLFLPCFVLDNATLVSTTNYTFIASRAGDITQPAGDLGTKPFPGYDGWSNQVLALTQFYIVLIPFNGTYPPANNTVLTLAENVTFENPGLLNRSMIGDEDNITRLLLGSCYCETTVLFLNETVECNYNITYNETSLAVYNFTIPNLVDPENQFLFCLNGSMRCCADVNCTYYVSCLCPAQTDYSNATVFNQTIPYNISMIEDFFLELNATADQYNIPDFDSTTLGTMVINFLGLVLPNDTAPFSDVLVAYSFMAAPNELCLINGTCELPLVNNIYVAFDIRCNRSMPFYNQSEIEEWTALAIETHLNLTGYNGTAGNTTLINEWLILTNFNISDPPIPPLVDYFPPQGVLQCPCDEDSLMRALVPYDVGNQTAGYNIDFIPSTIFSLRVSNNRANQLPYGWWWDRVPHSLITSFSLFEPWFFDELATLREVWRQDNKFINGTKHQFAYGSRDVPLSQLFCDDGCPLQYATIDSLSEFDPCIVDNSAGAESALGGGGGGGGPIGGGPPPQYRVYFAVQDAIDAGCSTLILVATENFYPEDLVIKSNVKRVYSFDNPGASIVGTHTIETDTLGLRGLHMIHSGDRSVPLFSKSITMRNMTIVNCLLDGNGVRGGGIFSRQDRHGFDFLAINYTTLTNWNYISLEVSSVWEFQSHYNTFRRMRGRVFDVDFRRTASFTNNRLEDVRGIKGLRGVSMFAFRVRRSITDACAIGPCYLFNNIQSVDVTGEDFDDNMFLLLRGQWRPEHILGNRIVKARTGMRFRELPLVNTTTIGIIVQQNSLNRPSNFPEGAVLNRIALNTGLVGVSNKRVLSRIKTLTRGIRDYRLDVFYQSSLGTYFKVLSNFGCNYPCSDVSNSTFAQRTCEVNQNFDNMHTMNYGAQQYRNYSDAHDFCRASEDTNQVGIIIPINGTGWSGGRILNDNITALFPVRIRSIVLPWEIIDDWDQPPGEAYPRSVVYGSGHTIIGDPFLAEDLEFRLSFRRYIVNMWYSQPDDFSITNVTFRRCIFDGRNLPTLSATRLLLLYMGTDPSRTLAESDPEEEEGGEDRKPPKCVPQSAVVDSCIFRNTYQYEPSRFIPGRGQLNITATTFPYTDPLYIQFLNLDGCTRTVANVTNNIFMRVDRRALHVEGAMITETINNTFVDSGGRTPNNVALVMISGNPKVPGGFLNFSYNVQNQSKEVLFPVTSQARSAMLAAYTIKGYADDALLCFRNNSAANLTIGARFYAMTLGNATYDGPLVSCLDALNKPKFYDEVDPLRRLHYEGNEDVDGVRYDLVFGAPYEDFLETFVYCNETCIPPDPLECSVSKTNISYVTTHPWWGKYFFNSLNDAIENCQAPTFRIRVDPNSPLTPYTEIIDPVFGANSSVYNMSLFAVPTLVCQGPLGTTGPLSGPRAVIQGCGHKLTRGRLGVENCIFDSTCILPSESTWNQLPGAPLPGDPPLLLELRGNWFEGNGALSKAYDGLSQNGLIIDGNRYRNYTGLDVVIVKGESAPCDVGAQVFVSNNDWDLVIGTALSISSVGGYEADNNIFNRCGCATSSRNMCAYFDVCRNTSSPSYIQAKENHISPHPSPIAQPDTDGAYCTGFYFDFVPDTTIDTDIAGNRGKHPGTCLRFVDLPNAFPIQDPEQKLRYYAQNKRNLFCKRTAGYDIEQAPPNFTDLLIRNNENLYVGRFCNDGCEYTNGYTIALILSIIFALLIFLLCLCIFTRKAPIGPRTYPSTVLGRRVPYEYEVYGRWYHINPYSILAGKIRKEKLDEEIEKEEDPQRREQLSRPITDGFGKLLSYFS